MAKTLRALYKQIETIGNQFNTWDIPLDKEVNLELQDDNIIKVNIG